MWGLLFSLTLSKSSLFTVIYFAFKYLTKAPLLLSDPSDGLCWDFCFHILLSLYQPLVHHLPCILFLHQKLLILTYNSFCLISDLSLCQRHPALLSNPHPVVSHLCVFPWRFFPEEHTRLLYGPCWNHFLKKTLQVSGHQTLWLCNKLPTSAVVRTE